MGLEIFQMRGFAPREETMDKPMPPLCRRAEKFRHVGKRIESCRENDGHFWESHATKAEEVMI